MVRKRTLHGDRWVLAFRCRVRLRTRGAGENITVRKRTLHRVCELNAFG
jgi:hypothetical protein